MAPRVAADDRCVLVVDDESSIRKVLGDLLRLRGYDSIAVGSAEEALALLETRAFAVAIVGINLQYGDGHMDGIELMRKVRESDLLMEFVVLTGSSSQKNVIDAVAVGAFGYLLKPFNVAELVGTLERALSHHRENAELRRVRRMDAANAQIVGTLRSQGLPALQKLVELGQSIAACSSLEEARALGRLVESASQLALGAIAGPVAAGQAEGTPGGE